MIDINSGLNRKIFLNLLTRIVMMILSCLALVYVIISLQGNEMVFTLLIGVSLIVIQIKRLTDYILKINRSLVQFINSAGYTEENVLKFKTHKSISDFELRINELFEDIGRGRVEGQKQKFLLKNVIDEMESGLLCVKNNDTVLFTNRRFRSLVGDAEIHKLTELETFSPRLAASIKNIDPVWPALVNLNGFKASLRAKEFKIGKDTLSLYSIQNIQQELDIQETESWERLIQVLTHEIMNSLSPIISLSKSMQRVTENPEKIRTGLSTIENTGEGLIRFIKEYRKLSDLPPPDKEPIEIRQLLERIKSLFNKECEKRNIRLSLEIRDPELTLLADPFQIEQVLVNLITNALDALSGQANGHIKLSSQSQSNALEIHIQDNGPGIPEDMREKIFIPFFSTKKKGMGIGLSLSKQIMTNHSAVLLVQSDPKVATRFTIRFNTK